MRFPQLQVPCSHLQNPLNTLSNNQQEGLTENNRAFVKEIKMTRYLTIALGVAAAAGVHAALFAAVLA